MFDIIAIQSEREVKVIESNYSISWQAIMSTQILCELHFKQNKIIIIDNKEKLFSAILFLTRSSVISFFLVISSSGLENCL